MDNKFFTKNEKNVHAKPLEGAQNQVSGSPPLKTPMCTDDLNTLQIFLLPVSERLVGIDPVSSGSVCHSNNAVSDSFAAFLQL